jgi:hypothetical protein
MMKCWHEILIATINILYDFMFQTVNEKIGRQRALSTQHAYY